ncbi:MAG: cytochrome c nitrite reductase small subunit [Chloroflexota bacterium]
MSRLPLIVGIVALLAVLAVGLYATDFTAYLGNNPTTCNNCHVMDAVYEGWFHGGHQQAAVCADCHTPHALIPKYYVKAMSGYHHVSAFILGDIPDAIRAKPESQEVIQENCIRCHQTTVEEIVMRDPTDQRHCWDCHRTVAHGGRGISILPYQHSEDEK